MLLSRLIRGIALTDQIGRDVEITSLTCDSRTVSPGGLFAAFRGEKTDGTQFIQEALDRGAATGAAAPAIPVTDTVKRAEGGVAQETLDRSTLFAVQTPQVFQADLIRAAIHRVVEEGAVLTDDCAAVERLGMKVSLTQGSRENLKLTTPFDLVVGEAILDARERGEL